MRLAELGKTGILAAVMVIGFSAFAWTVCPPGSIVVNQNGWDANGNGVVGVSEGIPPGAIWTMAANTTYCIVGNTELGGANWVGVSQWRLGANTRITAPTAGVQLIGGSGSTGDAILNLAGSGGQVDGFAIVSGPGGPHYGVRIMSGANNCVVRNATIENMAGAGIEVVGALNTLVENTTIRHNTVGVIFDGGVNHSLRASIISSNGTGVYIKNSSRTSVDSCIVQANRNGIEVAASAHCEIRGTEIEDSNIGVAVYAGSSDCTVEKNNIQNNGEFGVLASGVSATVHAEDNWWGHSSGPYHPTENPRGLGDHVSDNVDFEPWQGQDAGGCEIVVSFTDPQLEDAVRDAIGKPTGDICKSDLADLSSLDATERGITVLAGLEYCTALTVLELSFNEISDLSALSALTNLTYLTLTENAISDVSALSGLTNLTVLVLALNKISDVSPLSGLTNLQDLVLTGNQISDVSPLSGLLNLKYLWLLVNQITDVTPLSGLRNLEKLGLSYNRISNVSPLSGLSGLKSLFLTNNDISDVTPLSGLTKLELLYLHHNLISDIGPLSGLRQMKRLLLGNNDIVDISPLKPLVDLVLLDLKSNRVNDLSALADLLKIGEVDISNFAQEGEGSCVPAHLRLDNNAITNLQPLVDNAGIGSGDIVDVRRNQLDISFGSDDMEDINTLRNRGVTLCYEPQNSEGGPIIKVAPCSVLPGEDALSPPQQPLGDQAELCLILNNIGAVEAEASTYKILIDFYDVRDTGGMDSYYLLTHSDLLEYRIDGGHREVSAEASKIPTGAFIRLPVTFDIEQYLAVPSMLYADELIAEVWMVEDGGSRFLGRVTEFLDIVPTGEHAFDCAIVIAIAVFAHWYTAAEAAGLTKTAFHSTLAKGLIDISTIVMNLELAIRDYLKGDGDSAGWHLEKAALALASRFSELGLVQIVPAVLGTIVTIVEGTISCSHLATHYLMPVVQGFLRAAYDDLFGTHFFQLSSPADILVTNERGQSTGYSNGTIHEEIDGSRVFIIEGEKLIFLPLDENYSIALHGTGAGKLTLRHVFPDNRMGGGVISELNDIEVTLTSIMEIDYRTGEHDSALRIDRDGDGTVDEVIEPREKPLESEPLNSRAFPPGWTMVSTPMSCGSAVTLFGTAAYRWNPATKKYDTPATIDPSKGYWVKLPETRVVTCTGTEVTTDITIDISSAGWHQISAPWPYPKGDIQVSKAGVTKSWVDAAAAGWVREAIYGYKSTDGEYTTPSTIDPWYGYWVRANVSGLTLKLLYASHTEGGPSTAPMAFAPTDLPAPPSIVPGIPPTEADLVFTNIPNPITDVHTTTFMVKGRMAALVETIKVQIFDLSGRLVYSSGEIAGTSVDWHTDNDYGEHLANGAYLWKMYALIDGQWIESETKKLAILR